MFYCDGCATRYGWPKENHGSVGACESCRTGPHELYDDNIPAPAPLPALVMILRGVPGTGKSTAVTNWAARNGLGREEYRIFRTDDFWTDEAGNYNFDPATLGQAHAWCFKRFLWEILGGGRKFYIVENTNCSAWEIAPYVAAANAYGLRHEIVTLWEDPLVAAKRNVHGVSPKTVMDMYRRMLTETLPPSWNHRVVLDGRI